MMIRKIHYVLILALGSSLWANSIDDAIEQSDPTVFLHHNEIKKLSQQEIATYLEKAQQMINVCKDEQTLSKPDMRNSLYGLGYILAGSCLVGTAYFSPTNMLRLEFGQCKDFFKVVGIFLLAKGGEKIVAAFNKEGRARNLVCAYAIKDMLSQEKGTSKKKHEQEKGTVDALH